MRDLTEKQYRDEMKRRGFEPQGVLGYWRLPAMTVNVSDLNAGTNRREKLAYMLRALARFQKEGAK